MSQPTDATNPGTASHRPADGSRPSCTACHPPAAPIEDDDGVPMHPRNPADDKPPPPIPSSSASLRLCARNAALSLSLPLPLTLPLSLPLPLTLPLTLSLFLTLTLSLPPRPAAAQPPDVGKPAPDFVLRDLDGAKVSLSDMAYPGPAKPGHPKKTVVLDFFRTDCAPCRKELPAVAKYAEDHRKDGVEVLLVALLEDDDGEAKLRTFLAANPVPFRVVTDPYELAAKRYVCDGSSVTLPSLFLVDREGVLRRHVKGLDSDVERALGPLDNPRDLP